METVPAPLVSALRVRDGGAAGAQGPSGRAFRAQSHARMRARPAGASPDWAAFNERLSEVETSGSTWSAPVRQDGSSHAAAASTGSSEGSTSTERPTGDQEGPPGAAGTSAAGAAAAATSGSPTSCPHPQYGYAVLGGINPEEQDTQVCQHALLLRCVSACAMLSRSAEQAATAAARPLCRRRQARNSRDYTRGESSNRVKPTNPRWGLPRSSGGIRPHARHALARLALLGPPTALHHPHHRRHVLRRT
jgi:hypothetical protein